MTAFSADTHQAHPYHLVNPSPWPLVSAMAMLLLVTGGMLYMHHFAHGGLVVFAGLGAVLFVMYRWWKDVIAEGLFDRAHTGAVRAGLRFGMALFITSEVMFFVAFFWAFFDSAMGMHLPIADDVWAIGKGIWPPQEIKPMDAWDVPLMNTLILLLSGTTVTWAHAALMHGDNKNVIKGLWLTVLLGMTFTALQAMEYHHAEFLFKDGVYASTFYMATGFHGFHVIVGTLFLAINLIRAYRGTLSIKGHLGFEFAAWYWHFVDVVWLFLFVSIYWWGGA